MKKIKCSEYGPRFALEQSTKSRHTKGGSITVLLTYCLTGLESPAWQLTIFIYLQNRLIQTSQTGGQQYSDTSLFSIPWLNWRQDVQSFENQEFYFNVLGRRFWPTLLWRHAVADVRKCCRRKKGTLTTFWRRCLRNGRDWSTMLSTYLIGFSIFLMLRYIFVPWKYMLP